MRGFAFLLLTVLFSSPVLAQSGGHCEKAQSTGDIITCISKHHEDAQNALNAVFDGTLKGRPAEEMTALKEAQQAWRGFRDSECDRQEQFTEAESLKRAEMLKCLTRLTEERAAALSLEVVKAEETSAQSVTAQFQTLPLWLNVLAADSADVFWQIGRLQNADLNCDGTAEQIITGAAMAQKKLPLQAVVAIAETPETGKPKTDIFRFPVGAFVEGAEPEAMQLCDQTLDVKVIEQPKPEEGAVCNAVLEVSDSKCRALYIIRSDEGYTISVSKPEVEAPSTPEAP